MRPASLLILISIQSRQNETCTFMLWTACPRWASPVRLSHGTDAVGVRPRCGKDARQDAVRRSPKVRQGRRTIKVNAAAPQANTVSLCVPLGETLLDKRVSPKPSS